MFVLFSFICLIRRRSTALPVAVWGITQQRNLFLSLYFRRPFQHVFPMLSLFLSFVSLSLCSCLPLTEKLKFFSHCRMNKPTVTQPNISLWLYCLCVSLYVSICICFSIFTGSYSSFLPHPGFYVHLWASSALTAQTLCVCSYPNVPLDGMYLNFLGCV